VRVTSKGQVTIPIEIRRKYGIRAEMEVEFIEREGGPQIVVRDDARARHAAEILDRMAGAATTRMTTDEIMRLWRGEE